MIDPVNPAGFLFQAVSDLTGGMVTDIKTAMVAMVTVSVILMGLDYLKDVLLDVLEEGQRKRDYNKIVESGAMVGKSNDDVDKELYGEMYQGKISKYKKKYS